MRTVGGSGHGYGYRAWSLVLEIFGYGLSMSVAVRSSLLNALQNACEVRLAVMVNQTEMES